MESVVQQKTFDGSSEAVRAVLGTRQLLHARLGLPLAVAACWVLVAASVQYGNLERGVALATIAAAGILMVAVVAVADRRARRLGLWAWAGNPSLAAPSDRSRSDPKSVSRLQIAGCMTLVALGVTAYFYGVTGQTVLFCVMAYGFVHMAIYCILLCKNLEMPEHVYPLAWFAGGGMWWLATEQAVAFIFGGGWLLMGLLLHARLRQFERMAHSALASGGPQEDAP